MSVNFDNDEHIILEVRKHWFVLISKIFFIFIAILAPAILYAVISSLPISFQVGDGTNSGTALFLFFYAAWLLLIWILFFVFWTDYYLDVWIVTNKKLISIEQRGLFRRDISTLHLSRVQDVTSEVHGVIATMMNFGDLHVQTAGENREFVISGVEDPANLRRKLEDALVGAKNYSDAV